MEKQFSIDWQKCAEALNLKLNLIGARLKELNRETFSADIAHITAQLVEEFSLDTDQMFIRPDLAELQKKLDSVKSKVFRIRFAVGLERSNLISVSETLLSELSFDFGILAAFNLEAKIV